MTSAGSNVPTRPLPLARFSDHFGVSGDEMSRRGIFDPILERDLPFSINPGLLEHSAAPELMDGHDAVLAYFDDVIRLLSQASDEMSPLWGAAMDLINFSEFSGTSLGFSARSGQGRGWGTQLRRQTLRVAKEIIDAGTADARIFELVGLFQDGVGPDLVSDMLGTILLHRLQRYTERVAAELDVPLIAHTLQGRDVGLPTYLGPNGRQRYVILVPTDVLSQLPQVLTRADIAAAAAHNDELRRYLNRRLGRRWRDVFEGSKALIRDAMIRSPAFVRDMLDRYDRARIRPYDFSKDPRDAFRWLRMAQQIGRDHPAHLTTTCVASEQDALQVVRDILKHFRHLVENTNAKRLLYHEGNQPRDEKSVQDLFQAIALTQSLYSQLDVSPEVNSGRGPVDFKFSLGREIKVLVEIKLANNSHLVDSYLEQVSAYARAEGAAGSFLLVVDLGGQRAAANLGRLNRAMAADEGAPPEVLICDAKRQPSASRLRASNSKRRRSVGPYA
ncbi:MAG: hypothetical protein GIX02_12125 [Candidatus Eremiobacteraeota bacterium]|nr:hypothetical protein [Candidatus Eremiobacteraeota bacterium]